MKTKETCGFGMDMHQVSNRVTKTVITVCNNECKDTCPYFVCYVDVS